jgi:hypothetical protein
MAGDTENRHTVALGDSPRRTNICELRVGRRPARGNWKAKHCPHRAKGTQGNAAKGASSPPASLTGSKCPPGVAMVCSPLNRAETVRFFRRCYVKKIL